MLKKLFICFVLSSFLVVIAGCTETQQVSPNADTEKFDLNVAVEYTDHAASFYYAQGKNLFQEAGLNIQNVNVYASGVGVAAAFTKGNFDASYMCLVPAIFTYANGGVPIKIVAGTHKNGYGLVVNSEKINTLADLEKDGIKIANGPQGTSTDFLQKLLIEKNSLNSEKIMANTVKMNAAKQLMALKNGKVDAVFVPEHFVALAASFPNTKILVESSDIWPDMQGSVLVVTEDLLQNHPEVVEKLKEVNQNSISLINENTQEAAEIIAQNLNINSGSIKEETESPDANLDVTPEIVEDSLSRLKFSTAITIQEVQAVIDKMYEFGYLTKHFKAEKIMALD